MQSDFWAGSKYFGPVQNILGPVKAQDISQKDICAQLAFRL